MTSRETLRFDALVVGGGIAGLQAALDLADQDYTVAVVEKDASIGGTMIRLSKVFPTLDCASCITTPKMAAAAHHKNIRLFTFCELESLHPNGSGTFEARILKKPRYVDENRCIGCRQCEYHCPVYVPDENQGGFAARKAIRVPFSNAVPQIAVLDAEHCMLCGSCATVCPTDAVCYDQEPDPVVLEVLAVIVATGFSTMPLEDKPQYGQGTVPNVITALQMERLLAPHGPYNRVLRPSDGMEPDSIAFVQCVGSRDKSLGVSYCSRVCCMYAIKQAMLLSGALPLADITIYYMDIRAFGKNYEQFFQNAQAMGIHFVKAKVAWIEGAENGSVAVRYEDQMGNGVTTAWHDLVVLSVGKLPGWNPVGRTPLETESDGFLRSPYAKIAPTITGVDGIFAAGAALGPKDIVDSIAEASAAAAHAASYLLQRKRDLNWAA
ncbi:CoB--CoM heterodisulfide reductase iron-sulfur subunit A family protein [Desulfosoma caldarium]|uniref:Heterodisulfide reductase subunit A n=1 Tax=Desulfosoma caldarium TaxID=610254 RepID=A0A3N1URW3_9BACT|nr:CoB--CoM heterodisulfide reductase iron-sulfur subunit A family protein [Desulfosoma caldarium]ROQ89816.1 heterodisulfide reductase subunit A [Desulfosoma caldarium]